MSKESLSPEGMSIEVPGPIRWRIAKNLAGRALARKHEVTTFGTDLVPSSGPVVSISNHRSDSRDVKALGWTLKDIRTPFMPAKSELKHGLKGWMMEGGGAIFFDRDDADSRAWVYDEVRGKVRERKHVHFFVEETSQNKGQELGAITPSPVTLAAESNLDSMLMVGIGGTENPDSKRLHLEFSELSLDGLKSVIELKGELLEEGKSLSLREAAVILAHTEDVPLASDETFDSIVNPDPSARRGQRRSRKHRDPETTTANRMLIYQLFTEQVVRRKLQEVVDVAYEKAA